MRNRISELRKSKGITQEEFAKKVLISRPHLSDIENGKCNPGSVVVLRVAKALDTTVEELFRHRCNYDG